MSEAPGLLLVRAGLIGAAELDVARRNQAQQGGTIGEHLVLAGLIDDEVLTSFYVSKLRVARVNANDLAHVTPRLLKMVPPDMAAEFRILPVATDGEQNLMLAMSDPANKHAVDEVTFFTGIYVVRAVATQEQIAWGLAHYYAIITPLARGRGMAGGLPNVRTQSGKTPAEAAKAAQPNPAAAPTRRRDQEPNPVELAPRSGVIAAQPEQRPEPSRLPAVVVEDDELTDTDELTPTDASVPHDTDDEDTGPIGPPDDEPPYDDEGTEEERRPGTEPILLERQSRMQFPRVSTDEIIAEASGSGDVVMLENAMRRRRRTSRQTQPGIAPPRAVDSRLASRHDTDVAPSVGGGAHTDENAVSRSKQTQPRSGRAGAKPADKKSTSVAADTAQSPTDGEKAAPVNDKPAPAAKPAAAVESRAKRPSVDEGWDVDDAWGPPGTTIPPALLGAQPGTLDHGPLAGGSIPVQVADELTGEVMQAENALPTQPAQAQSVPITSPQADTLPIHTLPAASPKPAAAAKEDPAELAAAMERSSNRLLETVRNLERAPSRDRIVEALFDHLAPTCRRRAFFAIKGGNLIAFSQQGASRPGIGSAELKLDKPSTFGEVALGRLPYHGTLSPAASEFVAQALGNAPSGEIVVVPVLVRGRAAGLLYGDGLRGRIFDEHQGVLGRAAGQALERIVKMAKGN